VKNGGYLLGSLILLVLLTLSSCSNKSPIGSVPVVTPSSQWKVDVILGSLNAVWGTSRNDFYVAGDRGVVFHYDGHSFHELPKPDDRELFGLWGYSDKFTSEQLFAVGEMATVRKYDGKEWMSIGIDDNLGRVHGIWGTSPQDFFVAGDIGVARFSSGRWSVVQDSMMATGIWGSSDHDLFSVGWRGHIFHGDGHSWTRMTSWTREDLASVWGASGSDVFAVGSSGTILHYDGSKWSFMGSGTNSAVTSVWGTSGTDVYATADSTILHFDGKDWVRVGTAAGQGLNAIWVDSTGWAVAVGNNGTIVESTSDGFKPMIKPSAGVIPIKLWGYFDRGHLCRWLGDHAL
jgi:hypothetical protein